MTRNWNTSKSTLCFNTCCLFPVLSLNIQSVRSIWNKANGKSCLHQLVQDTYWARVLACLLLVKLISSPYFFVKLIFLTWWRRRSKQKGLCANPTDSMKEANKPGLNQTKLRSYFLSKSKKCYLHTKNVEKNQLFNIIHI